jgi:hypothetical protein
MVMGKAYKHGRTIGRAGMNTDIGMSNKAEVGMALPGLIGVIIIGLLIVGVFV